MWFGRRTDQKQLSSLEVAKKLEEIFLQGEPREMIQRLKKEFVLLATDTEAYLCFVALYLLALRSVFQSGQLRLSRSVLEKIFQALHDTLLSGLSPFGLLKIDADAIPKRFAELSKTFCRVWEEGQEKAAGPDWYVAKEVCLILKGGNGELPPELILKLSSLLADYGRSIKGFFGELEKERLLIQ